MKAGEEGIMVIRLHPKNTNEHFELEDIGRQQGAHVFTAGGSPTKIDYRTKGTPILTSLLDDRIEPASQLVYGFPKVELRCLPVLPLNLPRGHVRWWQHTCAVKFSWLQHSTSGAPEGGRKGRWGGGWLSVSKPTLQT